jgi:uncharacterized protein (TIGR02217 family)
MAFIETPRFPDKIAQGTQFGPAYSTAKARNLGGYEVSNQNWSMPLYEGDVSHAVKTQALLDDLIAFFHAVAGPHKGFRFKDFADYTVTGAQGTLTVITADTTWQLYKTYTYGAVSATRKIQKPVSGVAFAGGGTYALDTATGIVTRSAGANPTSWTGEFDVPVRFNVDRFLPIALTSALYNLPALPIVEVRL